jgi:hypothetical protein
MFLFQTFSRGAFDGKQGGRYTELMMHIVNIV